jgi:hypothetical protein
MEICRTLDIYCGNIFHANQGKPLFRFSCPWCQSKAVVTDNWIRSFGELKHCYNLTCDCRFPHSVTPNKAKRQYTYVLVLDRVHCIVCQNKEKCHTLRKVYAEKC